MQVWCRPVDITTATAKSNIAVIIIMPSSTTEKIDSLQINHRNTDDCCMYIHVTTHALEAIRALTVNITPRIRASKKTETSPQMANIHGRLLLSKNMLVFFLDESVNKMQWSSCPWYFLRIFCCSFAKLPNEMIATRQIVAQATTMKPWKTRDPVFLTISVVSAALHSPI